MASPEASTAAPRLLAPILVVGLMVGVFVVLVWPTGPHPGTQRTPSPVAVTTTRAEAEAAGVLRAWDRHRADAWASGDAASLAALYVPGASAGDADVAMLGDWMARGLAVDGLTTQLLAVRVLDRGPRRWVLLVRDRVTGAVARGAGATQRLRAGTVTERRVVLRRLGGDWRVASVRPAPAQR